jgi:hypothetical protein
MMMRKTNIGATCIDEMHNNCKNGLMAIEVVGSVNSFQIFMT